MKHTILWMITRGHEGKPREAKTMKKSSEKSVAFKSSLHLIKHANSVIKKHLLAPYTWMKPFNLRLKGQVLRSFYPV